ncbi:outer membrane protein assembly factor BamB family protein [Streptomyces tagetis]|uniref:PQQ-binding-like beta-propeller repeat protein n=1 Tax=Streptomyces tagetis TaxID=2820809 RepID=A0A940XRH3_9ACTN|nr:PQQ-binding-like beta-propeller repeat protein [Streptomyces sp. RG38]MBQ0829469.1 PQQ-binding-like beta-propeller repeat protein [Streptomyces sp. RG38]
MTQPPPPPHQPPPGDGFGPPQDQPPAQPPTSPAPAAPPAGSPPSLDKNPEPQAPSTPPAPSDPASAPAAPPVPPAGPPQPGYGYPQTPPQPQPGYGYPGPPGAPQPYAPPQPGPYGAQPPTVPGYGYPQQAPTMPTQPQPDARRKARNTQLAIIVSAVVAIGLIIGSGVWYSGRDDGGKDTTASADPGGDTNAKGGADANGGTTGGTAGGKEKAPSDPSAKVLFQVPAPAVSKEDSSIVVTGSWVTDTVYAKSGVAEVVGYDPVKGGKLWTLPLAGPVCTASPHIGDGSKAVVVHQPAMPTKTKRSQGCSQVAVIDLDTGKAVWTKSAKTGDRAINFDNVTISGGTVAAGSTSGGVAWDLAKGTVLWSPKPTDSCYDAGYGGGPKLVAVRKCGSYGARQLHIQTIDAASGKVVSEYKMSKGIEYAGVVSTDPLVVAADVGDSAGDGSGISDFFSIDNKTGELRTRISAPGDQFAARCDTITKIEHCTGLAVGEDRLYIPTEEHDGSGKGYSRTNEVVAFDLASGKQTGQRADAGDGYTITPLRMDGGNVIAYKRPPYDKGGQIVSIDGASFEQTTLLENPATESVRDAETSMLPEYAEFRYSQGRLYMSQVFASSRSGSSGREYLAIAFGTTG